MFIYQTIFKHIRIRCLLSKRNANYNQTTRTYVQILQPIFVFRVDRAMVKRSEYFVQKYFCPSSVKGRCNISDFSAVVYTNFLPKQISQY